MLRETKLILIGMLVLFAMCGVEYPDSQPSIRQPGENITSVRFPGMDNVVKHLE